MEAPAEVEWSTAGKWRRYPAQPAAVLTGSAYPTPFPAKPYPLKTPQTPLCAAGLVPISYHQKLVSGPFPHTIKYPHRARVVSAVPGCLAVPPVPGYG